MNMIRTTKAIISTFSFSLAVSCLAVSVAGADDAVGNTESAPRNQSFGQGFRRPPTNGEARPQRFRDQALRGQGDARQAFGGRGMAGQGMRGADPQRIATMMMSRFDQDGDQSLDLDELSAMFQTLRERRGAAGAPNRRPGRQPGRMQGEEGVPPRRGFQRGSRSQDVTPGGVIPQRPPAAG